MKRFLVPALFVIDVADYEDENVASAIAGEMQAAANRAKVQSRPELQRFCMLDEELPTREVPWQDPEEHQLPGTYKE